MTVKKRINELLEKYGPMHENIQRQMFIDEYCLSSNIN